MKRQLYTGSNYKKALNIEDLERIAKKRLPNFVFEYVYGGSDDEHTLRHNRAVFDQYLFKPKDECKRAGSEHDADGRHLPDAFGDWADRIQRHAHPGG